MPVHVLLKDIGKRVKLFREMRKLSQIELAAMVDCDERTIQRIEGGSHATCLPKLMKIAKALVVDVELIVSASKRALPAELKKLIAANAKEKAERAKEKALTTKEKALRAEKKALTTKEKALRTEDKALRSQEKAERTKDKALRTEENAAKSRNAGAKTKENAENI